jgi:hypothetical protein
MCDEENKNRMIRLSHRGKEIDFGGQHFKGVSPDVYIYLDRGNFTPYTLTTKLNLTIQINPHCFPLEDFLHCFTNQVTEKTKKCAFHGDENTGLNLSPLLEKLLQPEGFPLKKNQAQNCWGFSWCNRAYKYLSIGLAANPKYGPVSTRQGNDFEGKASHFEIKFKRDGSKPGDMPQHEYLCLNIHLLASYLRNLSISC